MLKKTKKVISVILTIAILISFSSIGSFASDESTKSTDALLKSINQIPEIVLERYPDIATFIDKVKEYCKTERDYQKVENFIKGSKEFEALSKKYDNSIEVDETSKLEELMKTDRFKEQEKRINELAKKYYDFFKKNGYYPDGEDTNNENDLHLNSIAVTLGEGVAVMEELGYSMSETQLASALAKLGVAAALDGPLPVADCIALVTGVAILTYYVYTNIAAHQTAVCNTITTYFSYSASNSAANAVANSKVYWNNQSSTYFYVHLNGNPGGGITFVNPIQYANAITILEIRNDNENVFSALSTNAEAVASATSTISPPAHDSANYTNSAGVFMPNNLPHYHATILLLRQKGHSFHL